MMTLYYQLSRKARRFLEGCYDLIYPLAPHRNPRFELPPLTHRMPPSRPQQIRVSFIHWFRCWARFSDYADSTQGRRWLTLLYIDMDNDLDPHFWYSIAFLERPQQLTECILRYGRLDMTD